MGGSYLQESIHQDWFIRISLLLSGVFLAVTWLIFFQSLKYFKPQIPLHYTIYFGVDSFGPWWRVLVLPGVAMVIIACNGVLTWKLYKKNQLLSYFLVGAMAFTQFLIMLGMFFISQINR